MCGICLAQATFHPECPLGERQEITAAEISDGYTGDLPSMTWDEAAEQITRWNDKWDDENASNGNAHGTAGTVTYGYMLDPAGTEYLALTPAEIANVEIAIANFEEIANLDFIRVTDAGSEYVSDRSDMEMDFQAQADTNGGWMSGSHYGGTFHSATVTIGESGLEEMGTWAFKTALHEIGHAIGMPHPGDYNGDIGNGKSYYEDSSQFSVMSYFAETDTGADYGNGWYREAGEWVRGTWQPNGLMLHDIAAVQRLYGKNMETRTGDSVYGWNSNLDHEVWSVTDWKDNMIAAIWDAGGIDTIDGSGYSTDSVIDLREESFSSLGAYEYGNSRLINNVAIARDVKIENAIGGTGDDILVGNMVDADHSDSSGNGYNGNNTLDGGAGEDTVSYAASDVAVTIDLSKGGASESGYSYDLGAHGVDTLRSIENLVGSVGNDRLATSDDGGRLSGEVGNDILTGHEGEDRLDGGAGNDKLYANGGDDILIGGGGHDWLRGGSGADTLNGGTGFDWVDYFRSTVGVMIDLANDTAQGGFAEGDSLSSIERVRGSTHNDELSGNTAVNILRGNAGDDVLFGDGGNDWLRGGSGADHLDGGNGLDWADYFQSDLGVVIDLANEVAEGGFADGDTFTSIERVRGSAFDDEITGDSTANVIRGNNGEDSLFGDGGNDVIYGEDGGDHINGGDGMDWAFYRYSDDAVQINLETGVATGGEAEGDTLVSIERLSGSTYNDTFIGDDANNYLRGYNGADDLRGQDGSDTLRGDRGNDTLSGGAGRDTFIFQQGDGLDTITDFEVGADRLRFVNVADSFDELSITDTSAGARIDYGGSQVVLADTDSSELNVADFLFA